MDDQFCSSLPESSSPPTPLPPGRVELAAAAQVCAARPALAAVSAASNRERSSGGWRLCGTIDNDGGGIAGVEDDIIGRRMAPGGASEG